MSQAPGRLQNTLLSLSMKVKNPRPSSRSPSRRVNGSFQPPPVEKEKFVSDSSPGPLGLNRVRPTVARK